MSLLVEESVSDLFVEYFNSLWLESNDSIEVSVIIPTYNRFPLNLLTLYSLERQSFDSGQFEVILIDDGSTDETFQELTHYQAPFSYKYVKCLTNMGRAKVRNKGIDCARGNILIFLDAEMIVDSNFIQLHVEEQQKGEKAVVTGAFHLKNVFTTFFPSSIDVDPYIASLFMKDKHLANSYKAFTKNKAEGMAGTKPYCFFNREDVQEERYKTTAADIDYFGGNIIRNYGEKLDGFQFPWMAFMTGNVSLKKAFITEVGKFDEEFQLYGYEDWELGYRLYKSGAKFSAIAALASFHQEHPVSENKWIEAVINYHLFCKKHPDIDILLQGLELARITDLLTINNLLIEYKQLQQYQAEQYPHLLKVFRNILETTAIMLKYDIRHRFLLEASGIDKRQKKKMKKEMAKLKGGSQCPLFIQFFTLLF